MVIIIRPSKTITIGIYFIGLPPVELVFLDEQADLSHEERIFLGLITSYVAGELTSFFVHTPVHFDTSVVQSHFMTVVGEVPLDTI
jgi:hypothetical protein